MSEAIKKDMEHEEEMNMTPMIDIVFNLLIFFMVVTDLTQQELANLVLPLAHTAVQDKDNDVDDRVIINIDENGLLLHKGTRITLQELGTRLEHLRTVYKKKMALQGKSGVEIIKGGAEASKLFVLLRADRNTPWQHIQWVMTIMAEAKLYKLQFATKIYADSYYRRTDNNDIPETLVKELGGKWPEGTPGE
ncbi:MAG: biopolymer transporter ExbD [Planctomycetota bacterium]